MVHNPTNHVFFGAKGPLCLEERTSLVQEPWTWTGSLWVRVGG